MARESELDRLRRCLERAFPEASPRTEVKRLDGDSYVDATVDFGPLVGVLHVETLEFPDAGPAIAQLRTLLRADTDGAVADVLDDLAALHGEQPLTVEQLRTMAQARRAR
jgi:hypothetical protein